MSPIQKIHWQSMADERVVRLQFPFDSDFSNQIPFVTNKYSKPSVFHALSKLTVHQLFDGTVFIIFELTFSLIL